MVRSSDFATTFVMTQSLTTWRAIMTLTLFAKILAVPVNTKTIHMPYMGENRNPPAGSMGVVGMRQTTPIKVNRQYQYTAALPCLHESYGFLERTLDIHLVPEHLVRSEKCGTDYGQDDANFWCEKAALCLRIIFLSIVLLVLLFFSSGLWRLRPTGTLCDSRVGSPRHVVGEAKTRRHSATRLS